MKPSLPRLAIAGSALAALALASVSYSPSANAAAPTPSAPCIGSTAPAHFQHVIVLVEENKAYNQVMGPAPYQTSAGARGVDVDHAGQPRLEGRRGSGVLVTRAGVRPR